MKSPFTGFRNIYEDRGTDGRTYRQTYDEYNNHVLVTFRYGYTKKGDGRMYSIHERNDKFIHIFDRNNPGEKSVAGNLCLVKIFFTCQPGIFFDS